VVRQQCLFLAAIALSIPGLAQGPNVDPLALRRELLRSTGAPPPGPDQGYRLAGGFVRKAEGEEIQYRASYLRREGRALVAFVHEQAFRNIRFGWSGEQLWVTTPELTLDLKPEDSPHCVRYDYLFVFSQLLEILDRGSRDRRFSLVRDQNEVYIRGTLRSGAEATFLVNATDYSLRKTIIQIKTSAPMWLLPDIRPDGTPRLESLPQTARFELWFSNPVLQQGSRLPGRTDYVAEGRVAGSFFLEEIGPAEGLPGLLVKPLPLPWLKDLHYQTSDLPKPSLQLPAGGLPALRGRLNRAPWQDWSRINRAVAWWGFLSVRLAPFFPVPQPLVRLAALIAGMFFIVLLWTWLLRRRQHRRMAIGVLIGGCVLLLLMSLGGIASWELHDPVARSALAMQLSVRSVLENDASAAALSNRLLNFTEARQVATMEDLSRACQAYAAAYDLIRDRLPPERREEIELRLFLFARPLFGALQGWRALAGSGGIAAAGLGMVGLAIGHEGYVQSAQATLETSLRQMVDRGLYREGPGRGSAVFGNLVNLMHAFRLAGRGNYYDSEPFRSYVETTLALLSPAGTLPLFSDTSLEDSETAAGFLLKTASRLPEELAFRCISASGQFQNHGRYAAAGWRKFLYGLSQPLVVFVKDPFRLFQYDRQEGIPGTAPPGLSGILGGGQAGVLRSGAGPDALYLALNALSSGTRHLHRDILSFDLYGFGGLLLHGAGFPGTDSSEYETSSRTELSNSITLNGQDQTQAEADGIVLSLINQDRFDFFRVLADQTYDLGRVQRDVILVRPEPGHPGYYLLVDEVYTDLPTTRVGWNLNGRGSLASGLGPLYHWKSAPFSPPFSWKSDVSLGVYQLAPPAAARTSRGTLYSRNRSLNQRTTRLQLEWEGSARLCTLLYPRKEGEPEPRFLTYEGKDTVQIGETDWMSLGDGESRVQEGPLAHVSEYVLTRGRSASFPSVLMVQGIEFRFGAHAVTSSKPVTLSLEGLNGDLLNSRPDTLLEVRSPAIKAGTRFLLDGEEVSAGQTGLLSFSLRAAGTHRLEDPGRSGPRRVQ